MKRRWVFIGLMMLVCYSVHVTGNVRAAISWEINKWAHMSLWATGDNIRFRSEKTVNDNELFLTNKLPLWLTDYFWSPK